MSSDTSPTVRDAAVTDADAIADIYNVHIARGDCTMDTIPWLPDQVATRIAALNPRESLVAAEAGGAVVGWGAVKQYSQRAGYWPCCETSVYVRPALTGRGIGQAIMDCLIDRCREHQYHHVLVRIFTANLGSLRFHERNGFEEVGVLREVGILNGQWVDVTVMQRVFPEIPPPDQGQLP